MLRARRTYLIGVPLLLVAAVAAVLLWGQLQPKPPGFAPTVSSPATASGQPAPSNATPQPAPDAASTPATASPTAVATAMAEPVRYTVDARDSDNFVFFNFTRGTVVDTTFEALDWDFALQRTTLLTNSGLTNPEGPTRVVNLGETDLAAPVLPEVIEFTVDAPAGEDGDEVRNPGIPKWYMYNFVRHVVVARPNVYLVRTGGPLDALVRFDSYYCEDESPGCVTFHYRLVLRDAGDGTGGGAAVTGG